MKSYLVRAVALIVVALLPFWSAFAQKQPGAHRLVLCNDGGTLAAPDREAPIGIEGLVKNTITPLRDTMIDTLYWQIGTDPYLGTKTARLSEWFSHNTEVGPRWGEGREVFKTAGEWRIYENTREIEATGRDVPSVLIEEGHKAGIAVYLSIRFNDAHDAHLPDGIDDANMSPVKKSHPEWILGGEGGDWGRMGMNFGLAEVRDYRMALIRETIENYDADGIHLDFCRQTTLFKKGEEEAGAPLLTEMLREMRRLAQEKAEGRDRPYGVSVRVPVNAISDPTFQVETWLQEGLLDYLIVGEVYGWHYRLPIESFQELAEGTGVKVLAQNLCAFKEKRVRSARVLFGENNEYYSTEQFRADAARSWNAGADGIFIWNQHFLPYYKNANWDPQHWKEIGDPGLLSKLDKHYIVGPSGRGGNLPIDLKSAGENATFNVEVADSFGGATVPRATLRMTIEQLTRLDDLAFTLNGASLDRTAAIARFNYNECVLDFDVSTVIKQGGNNLKVEVKKRNPHVAAPLRIYHVEALVRYGADGG